MATVYRLLSVVQRQLQGCTTLVRSSHITPSLRFSMQTGRLQAYSTYLKKQQRALICISTRGYSVKSSKHQDTNCAESTKKQVDIGPGTWEEVYHGVLSTQIKIVKTFSLSTSILGLCVQPIIYQSALGSHLGLAVAVGSFVGFFTFVTPLLIHWISKKYVTALHYDKSRDIYIATTLSFFLRKKKLEFRVGDVKVPEVPGPFTTLLVNSRPLFMDPQTFSQMDHYGRLMGYDKPVDFHLGNQENEEDQDKKKE